MIVLEHVGRPTILLDTRPSAACCVKPAGATFSLIVSVVVAVVVDVFGDGRALRGASRNVEGPQRALNDDDDEQRRESSHLPWVRSLRTAEYIQLTS